MTTEYSERDLINTIVNQLLFREGGNPVLLRVRAQEIVAHGHELTKIERIDSEAVTHDEG